MKLSKVRWIEVVLLAPVTFTLGSALPFGILFTALTLTVGLAVGLLRGHETFLAAFRSSRELIALLLMMLGAAAGLGSLWLIILLGRDWVFARPGRRKTVVATLISGLAAVVYWFFTINVSPHDAETSKALLVWIMLLLAPSILALRYLCVLLRPARN